MCGSKVSAGASGRNEEDESEEDDDITSKKNNGKNVAHKDIDTIRKNCDIVLVFRRAATMKVPGAVSAPLSLCTEKRMREWFRKW